MTPKFTEHILNHLSELVKCTSWENIEFLIQFLDQTYPIELQNTSEVENLNAERTRLQENQNGDIESIIRNMKDDTSKIKGQDWLESKRQFAGKRNTHSD